MNFLKRLRMEEATRRFNDVSYIKALIEFESSRLQATNKPRTSRPKNERESDCNKPKP
jgi:hypothetical protein